MTSHFVSSMCKEAFCAVCKKDATHKISEELGPDDPSRVTYSLGYAVGGAGRCPDFAYVCCDHYRMLMGAAAALCPQGMLSSSHVVETEN